MLVIYDITMMLMTVSSPWFYLLATSKFISGRASASLDFPHGKPSFHHRVQSDDEGDDDDKIPNLPNI